MGCPVGHIGRLMPEIVGGRGHGCVRGMVPPPAAHGGGGLGGGGSLGGGLPIGGGGGGARMVALVVAAPQLVFPHFLEYFLFPM